MRVHSCCITNCYKQKARRKRGKPNVTLTDEVAMENVEFIGVVYYQPLKAESDAQRGKPKARCDVVVTTAPSAPVGKGKEMMSPGMYACRDIDPAGPAGGR